MRILITGGTGYLGQHLLSALTEKSSFEVAYTYCRKPLVDQPFQAFQMDLCDEASVRATVSSLCPDVVVHTAAMTSPAACEKSPEAAFSSNASVYLIAALAALPSKPLFIVCSTDQVHSGHAGESPYPSTALANPVNVYGGSKDACERSVREGGIPFVILRLSNMVGPVAPYTGASKFLQWLEKALAGTGEVELFEDEIRSFVHVYDVCRAIEQLIGLWPERSDGAAWLNRTFCCGGPEPHSRLSLARTLAMARPGILDDPSRLKASRREPLDNLLGYSSPLDISMTSKDLETVVGFCFRPLSIALSETPETLSPVEKAAQSE